MTNQRKTLRRSIRLPLSMGRRLPALTADVSRGGFSIEMPQVFMPGSRVHGYFLVNDAEVGFVGTVAWAEAGNPQLSVMSRMGVTFDTPPAGLKSFFEEQDARPKKLKKGKK